MGILQKKRLVLQRKRPWRTGQKVAKNTDAAFLALRLSDMSLSDDTFRSSNVCVCVPSMCMLCVSKQSSQLGSCWVGGWVPVCFGRLIPRSVKKFCPPALPVLHEIRRTSCRAVVLYGCDAWIESVLSTPVLTKVIALHAWAGWRDDTWREMVLNLPKSTALAPKAALLMTPLLYMGKMMSICHFPRALPASIWGDCSQILVFASIWGTQKGV